jgi:purine nucleoside phosphorylase
MTALRLEPPLRDVEALAEELAARGAGGRTLAIVLGSGLGTFAERLASRTVIPGHELEHLPRSRVKGHAGEIVLGELAGVPVIAQSGRVHLYEGRRAFEVTRAVRAFALLGVRGLVLTNAAGSLVPEWPPGTLLAITDHLNLQARSPLLRGEGVRACPDDELGGCLARAAERLACFGAASTPGDARAGPRDPAEIRACARWRPRRRHEHGGRGQRRSRREACASWRSCLANPA